MKTIFQEDLIMFKAIKRFVNWIRIRYYNYKLDMYELYLEEATLEMDAEECKIWSELYDKYYTKYLKAIKR